MTTTQEQDLLCFSCMEVNLAHDVEAFEFDILEDHTEGDNVIVYNLVAANA